MSTLLTMPPMADQDTINSALEDRIRDLELHLARINEKWSNQEKQNAETDAALAGLRELVESKFGAVFSRLSKLEVRIAMFAGLAALLGSAAVKYLLP